MAEEIWAEADIEIDAPPSEVWRLVRSPQLSVLAATNAAEWAFREVGRAGDPEVVRVVFRTPDGQRFSVRSEVVDEVVESRLELRRVGTPAGVTIYELAGIGLGSKLVVRVTRLKHQTLTGEVLQSMVEESLQKVRSLVESGTWQQQLERIVVGPEIESAPPPTWDELLQARRKDRLDALETVTLRPDLDAVVRLALEGDERIVAASRAKLILPRIGTSTFTSIWGIIWLYELTTFGRRVAKAVATAERAGLSTARRMWLVVTDHRLVVVGASARWRPRSLVGAVDAAGIVGARAPLIGDPRWKLMALRLAGGEVHLDVERDQLETLLAGLS